MNDRLTKEQIKWCTHFMLKADAELEFDELLTISEVQLLDRIVLHNQIMNLHSEPRSFMPSKEQLNMLRSIREKYITWRKVIDTND